MVDLSPFLNAYGWPLLALLAAGLVAWLVAATRNWLGAHAEFLSAQTKEKITDLENQALNAGVAYITNWAQATGKKLHPTVDSWVLRNAAQVALNHAAGILIEHDNSPDQVANRIFSHLPPEMISTDTTGVTIKTTTVTTETLPPIGDPK